MISRFVQWAGTVWWNIKLRRMRRRVDRLCARGLRLGRRVVIMPNVAFDSAYPWLIEVGDGCRISSDVRILAHDATALMDLGVTRIARVRILADTFIAERAVILPGVTIGPRAIIAAGAVVNRDVGEGVTVAGNPARPYGRLDEFLERTRETVATAHVVPFDDLEDGRVQPAEILAAIDRGETVFVRGASRESPFRYNAAAGEVPRRADEAYQRHFAARQG